MNTKYHLIAGMAVMLNVLLYSGMVPFEAETLPISHRGLHDVGYRIGCLC